MKVGDEVLYSPIIGMAPKTDKSYKILSFGEVCGSSVAWIEGKSGCVDVDALTLVSNQPAPL
jgi:hypothetical protein